jgi:hypothetical protein
MDNAIKKVLAAFLAPIAILGLVFTMFTASAFANGTTQQGDDDQDLAAQDTSIVIDVRPWCGWTALTAENDLISLVPDVEQDTIYDGDEINLVAAGQEFAIRVGPAGNAAAAGSDFEALLPVNCSWFDPALETNGVAVSTVLSSNSFTAVSSKNTDSAVDATMDFDTDGVNPLIIDNTPETCVGFTFMHPPYAVTSALDATEGTDVVTLSAADTTTNSFCSWTSDYSVSIPAQMKPMFGGSTYTYTGPTVTNTMVYSRP